MRGEELKGADADMAARDARQHGTGMRLLALDAIAGGHRGKRARRRDAHRRHRLGHEELAQHGADRRLAIAVARKRRRPRPFELHVEPRPVGRDDLAEQQRAAVAQLRREMPELMPRIGERKRIGAAGHFLARKDPGELCIARARRIDPQPVGKRMVEDQQRRRRRLRRLRGRVKARHRVVKTIVERKIHARLPRAAMSVEAPTIATHSKSRLASLSALRSIYREAASTRRAADFNLRRAWQKQRQRSQKKIVY